MGATDAQMAPQNFNFLQKWPSLEGRLELIWRSFYAWMTFIFRFLVSLRCDRFCILFCGTQQKFGDIFVSVNGIFRKARLRCFPAKHPSLRSLLSDVKYKIDNYSKTKNCTKKPTDTKISIRTLPFFYCFENKVTVSQKLIIAQKISFMQKMSARSIPIYPEHFTSFEESWIFWPPKRDMMWYEILRPSFF